MSRTPPTIVAPLPDDPRVFALAKASGQTTREAYACAAEAWAWMADKAVDDIVTASVESLDVVVDVEGFGQAMLQAELVGTVDGGVVLPAELRRRQRDDRGEAAAVAAGSCDDEQTRRRREQNRAASQRYRRQIRRTGSKSKPSGDKAWRTLGRVAGHEVRAYDGPHGCYAMVLGATIGGEPCRKMTAGDKAWSLDSVKLTDALPALKAKWQAIHQRESHRLMPAPLVPSYADFRDDAERLTMLAKLAADEARHADDADASSRHADASAASAEPSAGKDADSEQKSLGDKGLDASAASADRHADALSSMSSLSKSSSSHEEEDMGGAGRQAAGDHERDQGHAEPAGMAEYDRLLKKRRLMAERFADALDEDVQSILRWLESNKPYLRLRLEAAGIDPNTGEPVNADATGKPPQARAGIQATTEPVEADGPAAGNVDARGDDEPDKDFEVTRGRLVEQLRGVTVATAADIGVKYA
jgi:hypothetical protein